MMQFSGTNLIMDDMPESAKGMSRQSLAVSGFAGFNGKKRENPVIRAWSNLIMPETAFRDALSTKWKTGPKTIRVKSFQ